MSYNLTINGHDAPAEDVKAAAREAWEAMAEAGATYGNLSGTGNDGPSISLSFPEAEEKEADEDEKPV